MAGKEHLKGEEKRGQNHLKKIYNFTTTNLTLKYFAPNAMCNNNTAH